MRRVVGISPQQEAIWRRICCAELLGHPIHLSTRNRVCGGAACMENARLVLLPIDKQCHGVHMDRDALKFQVIHENLDLLYPKYGRNKNPDATQVLWAGLHPRHFATRKGVFVIQKMCRCFNFSLKSNFLFFEINWIKINILTDCVVCRGSKFAMHASLIRISEMLLGRSVSILHQPSWHSSARNWVHSSP